MKAFLLGGFFIIYNLPLNWKNDALSKNQVSSLTQIIVLKPDFDSSLNFLNLDI